MVAAQVPRNSDKGSATRRDSYNDRSNCATESIADEGSREIERMMQASGYQLTGPIIRRGPVYLADVLGREDDSERLVIDAHDGRLLFAAKAEEWPKERTAIDEFVRLFPDFRLWAKGIDLKCVRHEKPAAPKEVLRQ
jgi:hypothetical protein